MKRVNQWNRPARTVIPPVPLTDNKFQYTPAVDTDVQRTWSRFGWTPPSRKFVGGVR